MRQDRDLLRERAATSPSRTLSSIRAFAHDAPPPARTLTYQIFVDNFECGNLSAWSDSQGAALPRPGRAGAGRSPMTWRWKRPTLTAASRAG